eukprot:CAMPEP_0178426274 /NCGR_PEP_ID=MMETSP0689_2-20121128/29152_1 /TAXON_ID=160604 /ORGANISM="Amphidinium massartii, Strain CS-259" /LENGTH=325 /DNA_ID=CAMNT_0020047959 /DNA_START=73 /DNA_END=1050 /DNA_ORIENTATION=+
MYRYSRGQPGQSALPRGAGGHSNRAMSPEPGTAPALNSGGGAASGGGGGTDGGKEQSWPSSSQDVVILQLENEVNELRNACSWKDQRIAELSRTDVPVARLKRDVRLLAAELHHTRKELSDTVRELQELQAQVARGEAANNDASKHPLARDVLESSSGAPAAPGQGTRENWANGDRSANDSRLQERVNELQDENRQLRERLAASQDSVQRDGGAPSSEAPQQGRQTSSSSSQRGSANFSNTSFRDSYASQQAPSTSGMQASIPSLPEPEEEPLRPVVYSSANTKNAATIGPTVLQGIGTVDGVASVAKVLLSRIHSSVCAAHRRQ